MPEQVFTQLDNSFQFAGATKEYVPAPTNKLLKFHVSELETTEQINNFKTNPDGTENSDYGKPQPVLIFKAELDEGDAKGQVYSRWITGYYKDGKPQYSLGDKSNLGKIAGGLVGSVAEFTKLSAGDLLGMPFQCALQPGKKDPLRLTLNIDKIMPPSDDQHKVNVQSSKDVVLNDIPDSPISDEELNALFS
jgi:hypothetical protein